jgi:hypothetical protein
MSSKNYPSNYPLTASASPHNALAEFFDQYSLPESKAMLWNWYKATTTGNFANLDKVEWENLATFYERIDNLLNAAHAFKDRQAK